MRASRADEPFGLLVRSGLLRLLLSDLEEQAIELSQDVASRSLLVVSAMRRTDDETGAGSRIENALGHPVLPP
jgi:hypothetical protein